MVSFKLEWLLCLTDFPDLDTCSDYRQLFCTVPLGVGVPGIALCLDLGFALAGIEWRGVGFLCVLSDGTGCRVPLPVMVTLVT